MVHLLIFTFLLSIQGQQQQERHWAELVNFVELNLMGLLKHGDFPRIFNTSLARITECGCSYSPRKILWGNQIGKECEREILVSEDIRETCGLFCNDQRGSETVLFCPPGWTANCRTGCHPTPLFNSFEDRVKFWELTLSLFLSRGTEYIRIDEEHMRQCGCASKARRILYGTEVGFDCVVKEGFTFEPGCNAARHCQDNHGRQIATFCLTGHRSECTGCEKDIGDDTIAKRLEWMVQVTSQLAELSLETLHYQPDFEQLLACGCKANVKKIMYGARIGWVCEIYGIEYILEECGPNVACKDIMGKEVLHICPKGFIPSCKYGCANPILWTQQQKEDL